MAVYTIAELGSSLMPFTKERLNLFLTHAMWAGTNAVKIQLFRADHFPNAERAEKQRLEFPRELFEWFIARARFCKLHVGASVFDKDAIDLCCRLGTDFIKLATREQHNLALREHTQQFKGPIIRSIDFMDLPQYESRLPREVTLGCVPKYPTPFNSQLRARMAPYLAESYLPDPWGWSSHTIGLDDVIIAVQAGAKVIEKHLRVSEKDIEARWSLDWYQWETMERIIECL